MGQELHPLKDELSKLHTDAYGWALSLCEYRDQEAEEILQMAYVRVLEGSAKFEQDGTASLKTWFFAVVRNCARERRRGGQRSVKLVDRILNTQIEDSDSSALDQEFQAKEESAYIMAQIQKLPEKQREVIELTIYRDMTLEEAAKIMCVQLGTAKTHYARAKKILAKTIGKDVL